MLAPFLVILASFLAAAALPTVKRDQSPVTLPLVRRFKYTPGDATLPQLERERIKSLASSARSGASSLFDVSATNGVVDYTASVGVGSPATYYTLIVDTGSSNTWVGADQSYVVTSTSEDTGETVSVTYGSGDFSGEEYTDTVTLASGFAITAQSIGVASESSGFSGVDGILGIGPEILTEGTLSDETEEIPTVTQNAYSQGLISVQEIGISFEPTTTTSDTNGELDFGGVDSSKYTGTITYTDITTQDPAGYYVGITQSVTYGSESLLSTSAGIADTGTTLIYLPTSAYDKYQKATGATLDEDTGLLRITTSQYDDLDSVYFDIGGTTYEFTANAQIWPRSLNEDIGGSSDYVYLVINDFGDEAETGFEFINGYTFLERFYFVYDSGANQVGFATTSYTDATTN